MDGRQKKRKPYSLKQVQTIMATAIRELEMIYLDTGNDADKRIRAINALASLSNSYSRLVETADLEARIAALETNQMRKVG